MPHSNLMYCVTLDKTPIPDALCDLGQDLISQGLLSCPLQWEG